MTSSKGISERVVFASEIREIRNKVGFKFLRINQILTTLVSLVRYFGLNGQGFRFCGWTSFLFSVLIFDFKKEGLGQHGILSILFLQEATLADMFLVGVYGFIFTSFVVSIVLLKLQRKKMFDAAETFYKYAEWMVRVNIFFTERESGAGN